MNYDLAFIDLKKNGYFVEDHFLNAAECKSICADYKDIFDQGLFQPAGTSKSAKINTKVRDDQIYWLTENQPSIAQQIIWDRLAALKGQINSKLFLGLQDLEGHYSHYPINGSYKPHLDRFSNDDARIISIVIYFNTDWATEDGGQLSIQSGNAQQDLTPLSGRLVCFLSAEVLHEVLITHTPRLSFAGWWRRQPFQN